MTEADSIVLEHLRAIRSDLAELKGDVREVKGRLGILEQQVASLHVQYAQLSVRQDRMADDIALIRKRLDLTEAAP
jgi:septal ring factor EnvC (AmiA/AmiB activator)